MSVASYLPETNAGTATSYLPLTTPWGWNPNCSNILQWHGGYLWEFYPTGSPDVPTALPCAPPQYEQWYDGYDHWLAIRFRATESWIGPLASPTNVPVASTVVKYQSRTLSAYCPPEYTLNAVAPMGSMDYIPDCTSAIQRRTPVTYMTHDGTGETRVKTKFEHPMTAHAVPVLGWNINDPEPGPATATATATSSFDATSSTSTQGPIPGSNGLLAGAKVGLGVGITTAITGVIVGAFLVYLRIKRRADKSVTTELHPWMYGREPSEYETPVHSAAELPAIREPTEMEG
ncbi:hypothetical protein ABOM_003178 [Aspergillus bombycis]|uniref:Uncharacterized protein n=1 Tax=Aspergillus bombycis TaxID=109264 RepID=A0A1F8AB42_9EURO|nr:hypothetical protein ABOM_003178 [Aspergillus bombycis]OGM48926.1 hypothetical protein ABOM_003178 [Aspergillus bombycis]